MATLRITFTPASPAPANGYLISYRRVGTGDPYSTATASASPVDITVTDGWEYEGSIRSDCGSGNFSSSVAFTASLTVDDCYLYEFINLSASAQTIYYKLCNTDDVISVVLDPGDPEVVVCVKSDYVFVNSTQIPPGTSSTSVNGVSVTRATNPSCL